MNPDIQSDGTTMEVADHDHSTKRPSEADGNEEDSKKLKLRSTETAEEDHQPQQEDANDNAEESGMGMEEDNDAELGKVLGNDDGATTKEAEVPANDQEGSEEDADWLKTVAELSSQAGVPSQPQGPSNRLERFMHLEKEGGLAAQDLESDATNCGKAFESAAHAMLDLFCKFNQDQSDAKLGDMDPAIVRAFTKNHNRRQKLLAAIQTAKKAYETRNESLLRRVGGFATSEDFELDNSTFFGDDEAAADLEASTMTRENEKEGGPEDPDWNLLATTHEPNRQKIDLFHKGRHLKAEADKRMTNALNKIEEDIKKVQEKLYGMVLHVHESAEMGPLARDIRVAIHTNHQRRQHFQHALDETSRLMDTFFSGALARVQQGSAGSKDTPANAQN